MQNKSFLWHFLLTFAICLVLLGLAAFLLLSTIPSKQSTPAITVQPDPFQKTVAPNREQKYEGEIPDAVQDAQMQQALLEKQSEQMKLARSYLSQMTLDEKIYQLFFVSPEQLTGEEACTAFSALEANPLENMPVGGIILYSQNLIAPAQTSELIAAMQAASRTPLFIGVDEEGGSISRLGKLENFDVPRLSAMKTYADKQDYEALKADIADLASSLSYLGFNMNFAPVGDVAVTNDSPIGSRSFGSDPTLCADMASAAVVSMQTCKVAACVKHFPGYGGASKDGNSIDKSLEELEKTDFLPFQVCASVDCYFTMVCHASVPQISGKDVPANQSKQLVTDYLRNKLAFSNIIITDAQNTTSVTSRFSTEQAVLNALGAGCDMILMPQNLSEAYSAVLNAVQTGKLSTERLDESVLRILCVKAKLGLLQ